MPRNNKTLTAVTLTIVNTACLVWLAYLIFVIAVFYGMTLLVAYNPVEALGFYVKPAGYFLNLPEFFFAISILAVIAALLGSFVYLSGSRAKWRQIFLLCIASLGLLSYSYALCWLENWVYADALSSLKYYEEESESLYHQQELSKLKTVIKQYETNKNGS